MAQERLPKGSLAWLRKQLEAVPEGGTLRLPLGRWERDKLYRAANRLAYSVWGKGAYRMTRTEADPEGGCVLVMRRERRPEVRFSLEAMQSAWKRALGGVPPAGIGGDR